MGTPSFHDCRLFVAEAGNWLSSLIFVGGEVGKQEILVGSKKLGLLLTNYNIVKLITARHKLVIAKNVNSSLPDMHSLTSTRWIRTFTHLFVCHHQR
jgi:hypothetical protein